MAMRNILFVAEGQSNWAGAGRNEQGGLPVRRRSVKAGLTDPFPGCNNLNQGGSCFPQLIDLCYRRGVRLDVLNYAIGGASVFQYTGRLGATITNPTVPASVGYFSGGEMSGGTTIQTEDGPDFDPFGLQARMRAGVATRLAVRSYDAVIGYWCNGESDAGSSAASYSAGLQSVANYALASACDEFFVGLTSKPASASGANFDLLSQGIDLAVAAVPGARRGHSMWAKYGSNPPLYAESDGVSYVHLTIRGQDVQAALVDAALAGAGY